jgi:SAM-dependent methyltransferase
VTDLMHAEEIRRYVKAPYSSIQSTGGVFAKELYGSDELGLVPASAIDMSLGVANHLRWADLFAGASVLDIGCGGGIDSILAGHRVGPAGTVVALDFLPEMLDRTAAAAVHLPRPRTLFDDEIIGLMRRLLPPERHDDVVTAVVFRARLGGSAADGDREAS